MGYFRNFIPNCSAIAAPLTDLTKRGLPNIVEWKGPQDKAYHTVKNIVTRSPILHLPDFIKGFYLRTEASSIGLGAIMMQEIEGKLFQISFASKELNKTEQKRSVYMAIVWAVKIFRSYLHGKEFVIETDHDFLQYLDKSKFINAKLMRKSMVLQHAVPLPNKRHVGIAKPRRRLSE